MDLDTLYEAAIAGLAKAKAELEEKAKRVEEEKEYTILHTESENGNIERVRFILKEFANENLLAKITIYKHTALHLAIYSGYTEVAKVLIDAARQHMSVSSFQAFLRQGDKDKDTALHAAVMEENVDIVKLLVEADRTDRHTQNDEGKTPMYIAVENGFNEIAEIISTTCNAPSFDGPYGSTVVRINDLDQDESPGGTLYKIRDADTVFNDAIAGDADSIARLEMEADKLNYYGETILHVVSELGKAQYVRFILREFAKKNLLVKVNSYKQTALQLAASNGNTEAAKVLIDAARLLPPSANDNSITSFPAFLRQGDENKDTALHLAVERGDVDIVKLLVEADPADRHIQNDDGQTPLYIAAENGYFEIVKAICTTCTAPSLEGPERSTALHAFISNSHEAKEENKEVTRMLIDAAKKWSSTEEGKNQWLEAFFNRTAKDGLCLLELAAGKNDLGVVKLLLENDPAYRRRNKKNSVMRSIYISVENKYSEMVKLLTDAYEEAGKIGYGKHKGVVSFIVAIKNHDKDEIIRQLKVDRLVLNFTEDEGWTPLHYAAYHKFDLILELFIEEQKQLGHPFSYGDNKPTPFHVAAEKGFTHIVKQLMQLWPPPSSSAFSAVNKVGRNILHIAAAESNKEMIQCILRYCPPPLKETMLKQQDAEGNTFFHLLFNNGCYIPEVIKDEGLVTMTKNKEDRTPRDMLYFSDTVIEDQAKIKLALDDEVQTKRSRIFWWKNIKKKPDVSESIVPAPKREDKDEKFNEKTISWKAEKHERMERERIKNLVKYKERTNTQIIVCALITTVTFTVGFTMPGGLYQSGDVNEGMVVLSKRTAFHTFMVLDALALLLSTSSLFFYFLGSMTEDDHQVAILGVASTVFNIVSIVAMMLTFIAGTYVVLSHSPALAITVCVISSLFFLILIVFLVKFVFNRRVKRNED